VFAKDNATDLLQKVTQYAKKL